MNMSDIDLRKEWEQLPTPDLEARLQEELERNIPDDDKVLLLLHILEAREPDVPLELTEREREAFERYRQSILLRKKKPRHVPRWLSVAASLALIIGLLISVVPQQAEAETFWEMLQRWTSTVLSYIDRDEVLADVDYVFKTENPGLQQVYDAVVELGVTDPVVPMWLPDGYDLEYFTPKKTPMSTGVWSGFTCDESSIVFKIEVYNGEPAHQYYKDEKHYESYEKNGTIFNITKNINRWTVVWTNGNIECLLTLDCQEDTLRRILKSIYVSED